jgi:hypothetical protein
MTELEARAPEASGRTASSTSGQARTPRPELTNPQKATLEQLGRIHDEVGPCRLRPDGSCLVTVTDYDEGDGEVRQMHEFTLYPDGVPC